MKIWKPGDFVLHDDLNRLEAAGTTLQDPPLHSVAFPTGGDGRGPPDLVNGARSVIFTTTPGGSPLGSGTNVADTIIMKTNTPVGNQVVQGAQLFMYPGSGDGWTLNPLVTVTAGTRAMASVAEFDINNWAGDGGPYGINPAFPYRSHGIWITGAAPYKCTTAAFITSSGGPQWYQGVWFEGPCVSDNTILDRTNSTVSVAIRGNHAIGLDTIDGTFSDSAVRMAANQKLSWVVPNVGNPVTIIGSAGGIDFRAGAGNAFTFRGARMILGDPSQGAGVHVLDFETSGNPNEYDVRLTASGGTAASAKGALNIESGALFWNLHPIMFTVATPAAPTAGDVPSGYAAIVKNNTDGSVRLYHNDSGTLRSVALA